MSWISGIFSAIGGLCGGNPVTTSPTITVSPKIEPVIAPTVTGSIASANNSGNSQVTVNNGSGMTAKTAALAAGVITAIPTTLVIVDRNRTRQEVKQDAKYLGYLMEPDCGGLDLLISSGKIKNDGWFFNKDCFERRKTLTLEALQRLENNHSPTLQEDKALFKKCFIDKKFN